MRTRIGHLLVRDDLVTESQLSRALEVQNFAGGRIGTLLLERGALVEDELGRALAHQHGCGYLPWSSLGNIQAEVIAALPARFALKHCAIPYERGESYVKMALRDPSDLRILDELVFVTGRRILVAIAPEVRIYQALEKYYGKLRASRYAILAERLSRPQKLNRARSTALPPPPDFFSGLPATAPRTALGAGPEGEPASPGEPPPAPEARPAPPTAPARVEPLPAAGPPAWASFLGEPELGRAGENEGIAWEDTTGGRSKKRSEVVEPSAPAPFEEAISFDFGYESIPLSGKETDFSAVRDATERDAIAEAVLDAMGRRFRTSAIFSSRSEGIAGWAAAGEGVDAAAIREIEMTWTEPSVFLNTRLSRSFHLGPLPDLPRHDQLAVALGGWPEECVVEPVFIGERPVAFFLAAGSRRGASDASDLGFLHELARTAASAFENAIRLKKKEI